MPEMRGTAITHRDSGDPPVYREERAQRIPMGAKDLAGERGEADMVSRPGSPRRTLRVVQPVEKLEEEALIFRAELLEAESAGFHRLADAHPGDEASCSIGGFRA